MDILIALLKLRAELKTCGCFYFGSLYECSISNNSQLSIVIAYLINKKSTILSFCGKTKSKTHVTLKD